MPCLGGLASPCWLIQPWRSATRFAPPGPGGPRFARRCAQQLPGHCCLEERGCGARDLCPARPSGPLAGLWSTANTVWSRRHDEGGCAAAVNVRPSSREGTCSCTPTRPQAQTRQANLSTTPLQNRCSLDHWLVLVSVGLLVRTTAYVLCSGTLCWPCVAQCSSKMDSLADGSGSSPAEHHGDGTEAGWWAGAK